MLKNFRRGDILCLVVNTVYSYVELTEKQHILIFYFYYIVSFTRKIAEEQMLSKMFTIDEIKKLNWELHRGMD